MGRVQQQQDFARMPVGDGFIVRNTFIDTLDSDNDVSEFVETKRRRAISLDFKSLRGAELKLLGAGAGNDFSPRSTRSTRSSEGTQDEDPSTQQGCEVVLEPAQDKPCDGMQGAPVAENAIGTSTPLGVPAVGTSRATSALQMTYDAVAREDSVGSTLCLQGLSKNYKQEALSEDMSKLGFGRGKVDFLYLPMDSKSRSSLGYALVNFTSSEITEQFCRICGNSERFGRYDSELRIVFADGKA